VVVLASLLHCRKCHIFQLSVANLKILSLFSHRIWIDWVDSGIEINMFIFHIYNFLYNIFTIDSLLVYII